MTTRVPKARVGRKYRAVIRYTGPVSEARVDWRLPRGLRWRSSGDRIVITGKVSSADDDPVHRRAVRPDRDRRQMTFRLVAR